MHEQSINTAHEMTKAAPALAGTGYTLAGLPFSEWAALLTCIYVLAQLILLIPKYVNWYKQWRSKRACSRSEPPQS